MQLLLKDIADIKIGLTLRGRDASKRTVEEGLPLLRISDLHDSGVIEIDNPPHLDPSNDALSRYTVEPEDIVMANRGTRLTSALIPSDLPAIAGGQLFIIRTLSEEVRPAYLCLFLNLKSTQDWLLANARGSYVKSLSKGVLENLPIPVPSLAKQDVFNELAILQRRERSLIRRIEQQRENLIDSALQQMIRAES